MDLLLPTDGCGNCITDERSLYVHPYRVTSDGTSDGIVAFYRCPECRYSWWTTWGVSALELPCPGCAACVPGAGAA